ncbi:MAG: hypothetical protein ACI87M_000038, partial [Yoonia sp.]
CNTGLLDGGNLPEYMFFQKKCELKHHSIIFES